MVKTFLRKQNIILALLIIMALVLTAGCTKTQEPETDENALPVVNEVTLTTYNQFALELLKASRQVDENIILSPVSAGLSLTMLRLGAEGDTAKGIEETLGMAITDYELVESQCKSMVQRLNELSGVRYETAIGLYLDEGPSVIESYAVMAEENFGAEITFLNLEKSETQVEINDWADIMTSGRIEKLVGTNELSEDLLTLYININAMDCVWETEFDSANTRPLPFSLSDGKGVAVPMMRGKLRMNFYEDESVTAAFIPLSGEQASLAIILPSEDTPLYEFIDNLNAEDIELWRYISVETEHYVNIPEIQWQQKNSMIETFSAMGAGNMFDAETADFSNLGIDFFIGDMWHTTVFRATETGDAESTLTAIDLTRAQGNGEYFFSVDRPFLFAVIDDQSGGILMIGTMTNPLKSNTSIVDE